MLNSISETWKLSRCSYLNYRYLNKIESPQKIYLLRVLLFRNEEKIISHYVRPFAIILNRPKPVMFRTPCVMANRHGIFNSYFFPHALCNFIFIFIFMIYFSANKNYYRKHYFKWKCIILPIISAP